MLAAHADHFQLPAQNRSGDRQRTIPIITANAVIRSSYAGTYCVAKALGIHSPGPK